MEKIWANSGDSHFLEPLDLWQTILPAELADRMPRSEIDGDEEIVHVDGITVQAQAPDVRPEASGRQGDHRRDELSAAGLT